MTEESKREEIQKIGKMVLFKNSLIFKNTIYQISNICAVWVADQSYEIKHKFPTWIIVAGALALVFIAAGFQLGSYIGVLIGIALAAAAIYGYRKHNPQSFIEKFALGFELASGSRTLFVSSERDFVQQAAQAMLKAISEKEMETEKIVMNFDNKSINVESAQDAIIVGGDVKNSLVEVV